MNTDRPFSDTVTPAIGYLSNGFVVHCDIQVIKTQYACNTVAQARDLQKVAEAFEAAAHDLRAMAAPKLAARRKKSARK